MEKEKMILYILSFIMISTFFGHLSMKSYNSLSLLVATFVLVYKIYDNISYAIVVSVLVSSFYKTFVNKKEGLVGFGNNHHPIRGTVNQHLGIPEDDATEDDATEDDSDEDDVDEDATEDDSDEDDVDEDDVDEDGAEVYDDILEESDSAASGTYNNQVETASQYQCNAHLNSSPYAASLCDEGHEPTDYDTCSTGCKATKQLDGMTICCKDTCSDCGEGITRVQQDYATEMKNQATTLSNSLENVSQDVFDDAELKHGSMTDGYRIFYKLYEPNPDDADSATSINTLSIVVDALMREASMLEDQKKWNDAGQKYKYIVDLINDILAKRDYYINGDLGLCSDRDEYNCNEQSLDGVKRACIWSNETGTCSAGDVVQAGNIVDSFKNRKRSGFGSNNEMRKQVMKKKGMKKKDIKSEENLFKSAVLSGWNAFKTEIKG
jgi:hypothetical protein